MDTEKFIKDETHTLLDLTAFTYKNEDKKNNWLNFLLQSMYTYKYPFEHQLQIYSQTKDSGTKVKAVAGIDLWNKQGYKLKDAKTTPIELLINNYSEKKELYDISQMVRTDGKDTEKPFKLWNIPVGNANAIRDKLIEKYTLKANNETSLNTVIFLCLEEKFKGISDYNKEKYGVNKNISQNTFNDIAFSAFVSAQITIIGRLGSSAGTTKDEILSMYQLIEEKILRINTRDTITALGEITNTYAKEMLQEIATEVKNHEKELNKKINRGQENELNREYQQRNWEQVNYEQMGQDATGISKNTQQVGVLEVNEQRTIDTTLHTDTRVNAKIHGECRESDYESLSSTGENTEQDEQSYRMDTGNEPSTSYGNGNSHKRNDRKQLLNIQNHKVIAVFNSFDISKYGKPWVSAISRGKNYFSTKEGQPIGGYTGDAEKGEGGKLYVINPQDGRIYGFGQKNKENKSDSVILYSKYQDREFVSCDKQGNLIVFDTTKNIINLTSETIKEEINITNDLTVDVEQPLEEAINVKSDTVVFSGEENIEQEVEETQTKTDWEVYLETITTGPYYKQYRGPFVAIDFSESSHFNNNELLSFSYADRKFKEVETQRREELGGDSGYDKTFGAVIYKHNPEDTELSAYEFRYDIGDYYGDMSGLFNHINNFWSNVQEEVNNNISSAKSLGYTQQDFKNVENMLSILEPYTDNARQKRLNEYFEQHPPHVETRPIGDIVLMNSLSKNMKLEDDNKRRKVKIEEPIGKYAIYSREDTEYKDYKLLYIMTPSQ